MSVDSFVDVFCLIMMSLRDQNISESHPKPLQACLGGIGIALSVHSLLVLNGSVLGVSGFVHRSFRGDKAAMFSIAGLTLGGIAIGMVSNVNTPEPRVTSSLLRTLLSGLLVGIGTKVCSTTFFRRVSGSYWKTVSQWMHLRVRLLALFAMQCV